MHLTSQQTRLQEDLRGLLSGEVRCDPVALQLYSADASIYEATPSAVIWPKSTEDVVACVQYSAEKKIPIHPRGAGTGSMGGCLGKGIVLDFTRFMRRALKTDENTVRVQPGAVRERMNSQLQTNWQRQLGPDPGYGPTTTIGSILASDGAGPHWIRYGSPRDHLLAVKVVLATGEVLELRTDVPEVIRDTDTLSGELRAIGQVEVKNAAIAAREQQLAKSLAFARGIVHGKANSLAEDVFRILAPLESQISQWQHPSLPDRTGYRVEGVIRRSSHLSNSANPALKNTAVFYENGLNNGAELTRYHGHHGNIIRSHFGESPPKISRWSAEDECPAVDIARLFTGSEGTLGIITEAVFRTVAVPRQTGVAILMFDSLDKSLRCAHILPQDTLSLCELLDRRRIHLVCEWDKRFAALFPSSVEAALFVEVQGDTQDEVADKLHHLTKFSASSDIAGSGKGNYFTSRVATKPEDVTLFYDLLRKSKLALYQLRRNIRAIPLFGSCGVPTEQMTVFLQSVQSLFQRAEVNVAVSGHVGHGNLRLYPILATDKTNFLPQLESLAAEVYSEVLRLGGTLSTEDVCGLGQTPFVSQQHPQLTPIFRKLKDLFDPNGLLNPGKVVLQDSFWQPPVFRSVWGNTVANATFGVVNPTGAIPKNSNKRPFLAPFSEPNAPSTAAKCNPALTLETMCGENQLVDSPQDTLTNQLELQLKWNPQPILEPTYRCNGCGRCRSRDEFVRMCPVFRFFPHEEMAPRSKANLLRGVLEGDLPLSVLTTDMSKQVADSCIHCMMCRTECPAAVDVATLVFQCKNAYIAGHGLPLIDQVLSNIPTILKWFGRVGFPINWSLSNPSMRWLFEKLLSLPQGRKLPKLAKIPYLKQLRKFPHLRSDRFHSSTENTGHSDGVPPPSSFPAAMSGTKRKVALFLDIYSNLFDPTLAEAAVEIFHHHGIEVLVPEKQRVSGFAAFTTGNRDHIERLAHENTLIFGDIVRQGYDIVALEPTAVLCFKVLYPSLLEDEESTLIAANTSGIFQYLHKLHTGGELRRDMKPLPLCVGYHAPCKSLVVGTGVLGAPTFAEEILRLIPELEVRRLERGCCGLAHTFGLKQSNYLKSLRLGIPLFSALRNSAIHCGTTECTSCKMQMEQGATKPTVHPLKLLAISYGLRPDFEACLHTPSKRYVVS